MSEEKHSTEFAGRGSTADPGTPLAQGLYDPALDKDSPAASASSRTSRAASRTRSSKTGCAFSATSSIAARSAPIRAMVTPAGILVQIPHKFFAKKAAELGFKNYRRPASMRSAICSCRTIQTGDRLSATFMRR